MTQRPVVTIEQDDVVVATGRLELPDTIIHTGTERLTAPLTVRFEDGCRFDVIDVQHSVHPPLITALLLPPGSADVPDPDPGPFWDADEGDVVRPGPAHKPLWCFLLPRLPYC